jgi:hypothetical protein
MKDSKGEAVGAGRRVVDELRTGGRLGLFATGGRLVERERLDDVLLSDARDAVERDDERDDDGVACERDPRCEPSEILMVFQPLRLSFVRTHQAEIQCEQQRQSRPCPLLLPLLLLRMLEFPPYVFQDLGPIP